jgi:hypothetical protein
VYSQPALFRAGLRLAQHFVVRLIKHLIKLSVGLLIKCVIKYVIKGISEAWKNPHHAANIIHYKNKFGLTAELSFVRQ